MEFDFAEVLLQVMERNASDLHLTAGSPPMIRHHGRLHALDYPHLTPQLTREVIYSILTNDQRQRLETDWQIDLAYSIPGKARFRVNAYMQRAALSAAFRLIPHDMPKLSSLGLPPTLEEFTKKPRGFVLVTGPTGSGKSTTLAAMIDLINDTRHEHILTIEDPIEFLHKHKRCIVNQRELGADAQSFGLGLKAALRQDPDVILVGEMRDLDTISTALTAAETGHLVFATLHTQDTAQTVDRIVDVFPPDRGWPGTLRRHRGARADPRGPEPDPRGQDAPDLLRAPDRRHTRHADDGHLAGPAGAGEQDQPRAGRGALLGARGAPPPDGHREGGLSHGYLRIQGT
jgi:twitching motility protein PilT